MALKEGLKGGRVRCHTGVTFGPFLSLGRSKCSPRPRPRFLQLGALPKELVVVQPDAETKAREVHRLRLRVLKRGPGIRRAEGRVRAARSVAGVVSNANDSGNADPDLGPSSRRLRCLRVKCRFLCPRRPTSPRRRRSSPCANGLLEQGAAHARARHLNQELLDRRPFRPFTAARTCIAGNERGAGFGPRAAAGVVATAIERVSKGENGANLRVEEGIRPQESMTCNVAYGAGATTTAATATAAAATVARRKKAPAAAQDGP